MKFLFETLRKKRMEKGFSQKEMANLLKISEPAYSKYENGKTNLNLSMITKFADALQMPVSELIDGKNNNIEIKNVSNSAISNENSTINLQNEKITDSLLSLTTQTIKLSDQIINLLQNQNELFKEMVKIQKR